MISKAKGKFWQGRKILVSLTTNSDWRSKLREITNMKLEEIALFLTGIIYGERKELYQLLAKSAVKKIPVVHLKADTTPSEIEYLLKKYHVKVFNLHSQKEYKIIYNLNKYKKFIYIENAVYLWEHKEVDQYAGVCLDLQHLERARILHFPKYKKELEFLNQKVPIGFNHVSPVIKEGVKIDIGHIYTNLNQFNYLNNFPAEYFSKYIALELENSIKEQLKARNYIIKLLQNKE